PFGSPSMPLRVLLCVGIQVGIVSCRVFQLYEEISKVQLEPVRSIVQGEKALDESLDLVSDQVSMRITIGEHHILRLQVGECVLQKVCNKSTQEFFVAGSCRCLIWSINWSLNVW